jgi:hypothetical protein
VHSNSSDVCYVFVLIPKIIGGRGWNRVSAPARRASRKYVNFVFYFVKYDISRIVFTFMLTIRNLDPILGSFL